MYIVPYLRGDEKLQYLRKSQTDDPLLSVDEVLSKHKQMLDDWIERNQPEGGPVPEGNIYKEIGSGETIKDRPAMLELLRRVEDPKIKAVMVTEPSRLTRGNLREIGTVVEILRYTKTLVITTRDVYDLNEDRDRDLFERELMRGNEYLEYTKKIRWNGRLQSVKNGNFIGQTAPYGYRKVEIKEGKQKCHTLEPIPERAAVVKRIFEMYRDGMGSGRISDQLNAEGIPSPSGKKWSSESIPIVLQNIHYLGKVRWNRRKTIRTVEDGQVVTSRPVAEEYLVFEGKHPAIIDQELWDAVQAIRGKHPRNTKAKNLTNPLAGILWCKCGRAMVGRRYNGTDGKERCTPRFLCGAGKHCDQASAKMPDVMEKIAAVLRESIEDFEVRVDSGADDAAEVHRQLVERLEKRLAELQDLEKKQWDEKIKGEIPPHIFTALNGETVAEIEEIRHALCEARGAVPEPIDLQDRLVTFRAALAALENDEAPVKEKNRLLKACIEKIVYSREVVGDFGHPKKGEEAPINLDITLRV